MLLCKFKIAFLFIFYVFFNVDSEFRIDFMEYFQVYKLKGGTENNNSLNSIQ